MWFDRKGHGPFHEAANAYFQGGATVGEKFFVVGPLGGVGVLRRLTWNIGAKTSGIQFIGASLCRFGDLTGTNYGRGAPLIERGPYSTHGQSVDMEWEIFDTIMRRFEIALSQWFFWKHCFVVCRVQAGGANFHGRHLVSVEWDRYCR